MSIGTLFTLFVTPAVYTYIAREHHGERRSSRATAPVGQARLEDAAE
jgi:hypothetical protein